MKCKKNIYWIIGLLIILLIGCVVYYIRFSCSRLKESGLLIYESWNQLEYDLEDLPEDSILIKLGNPQDSRMIKITGEGTLGPWMTLHRFQKTPVDTIVFKELFWKQGVYDFYIWLLPKDSVWRAVDFVKYDPDQVQF